MRNDSILITCSPPVGSKHPDPLFFLYRKHVLESRMTILQSLERSSEVEGLKGEAMRELGERQINATARNYLLTASRKASWGCLVSGERK